MAYISKIILLLTVLLGTSLASATPITKDQLSLLYGMGDVRYHHVKADKQDYHLFVRLPEEYNNRENQSFPVMYLLDGGITFPMFAGYYRYLRLSEDIPPMILVGVSYGTEDWRKGNARSHDFTAPTKEREHWGGAKTFSTRFETLIFPEIETKYQVDAKKRVLFGQSLGGQYAIYAALSQKPIFWGYIASNPALHRNLSLFLEPRPVSKAIQLFVSGGELDDPRFAQPRDKWLATWTKRLPKAQFQYQLLPQQNHFSAAPEAFRKGLKWLFR